jgi:hypothetical protein
MHSCVPNLFLGYDIQGALAMENCTFPLGMLNNIEQEYAGQNHFETVYILADINQEPARSYGLELDTTNILMEDALQSIVEGGEGEVKRYRAARLNSGNSFALDVTDPEFINGKSPEVIIEAYLLIDVNCTLNIYYHSASGMKLGITKSYADVNNHKLISFPVYDAMFAETNDILIEIEGSSPLLNYVSVIKNTDPNTETYITDSETLKLYPNPSSGDIITLETRGLSGGAQIILRNQNGVAVYRSNLSGSKAEIPVRGFPAGMYIVSVVGENSTIHSKLIIQ